MARILLIDDDDALRTVLRLTLVTMGHQVIEARDGRNALEVVKRDAVTIVLTDLIMPERDGMETIMELHQHLPTLKIIAMSGGGRFSSREYLPVARVLGAARLLTKPFTNAALAEAIAAVEAMP